MVVEKPFTVTTSEADRVLATAKKTNKILTVFQSEYPHPSLSPPTQPPTDPPTDRRYDSDFLTLQSLLQKSALGPLAEAALHYDVDFPSWISGWNSPSYTPGSGMLYGLGSHTIDQALKLFGPPATVTGFYRSLRGVESEIDDTFTVILQYNGEQRNLLVTVKTSIVTLMKEPLKFFVRGYDGTFVKYGTDPQEGQVVGGMGVMEDGFGIEEEGIWGELTTRTKVVGGQVEDGRTGRWVGRVESKRGDYLGYYRDLVEAIRGGSLRVRAEQSRDGIRIIELARESAEKGRSLKF